MRPVLSFYGEEVLLSDAFKELLGRCGEPVEVETSGDGGSLSSPASFLGIVSEDLVFRTATLQTRVSDRSYLVVGLEADPFFATIRTRQLVDHHEPRSELDRLNTSIPLQPFHARSAVSPLSGTETC